MTVGNLVAIHQRNLKRLLAYSSISQAGYVLVGIAALQDGDIGAMATRGVVLHLAGYVFTNLAAFGALIAFETRTGGRTDIRDMAGLARQSPFIALTLMAAVFSLAGMPLFAGFVTKFYLFTAAARAGLLWLVAIAVINSTISLYYYLIVVKQMYVGEARPGLLSLHRPQGLLTGDCLSGRSRCRNRGLGEPGCQRVDLRLLWADPARHHRRRQRRPRCCPGRAGFWGGGAAARRHVGRRLCARLIPLPGA